MKGLPFRPVKAIPVDMFPHTNHCELVVLFERVGEDAFVKVELSGDSSNVEPPEEMDDSEKLPSN